MYKYLFLPIVLLLALSCSRPSKYLTAQGLVWGTEYHVTFQGDEALADSMLLVMDDMSRSLNVFDTLSLVSRINSNSAMDADRHVTAMICNSRRFHAMTEGAFDPTLGPLIDAWGFGKGHAPTADTARLEILLGNVGIDRVQIISGKVSKPAPGMRFNFSAIAKGYGCDLVGEMLHRNGCSNFLIEIGGEICAGGVNPSGGKWRVSVDKPIVAEDGVVHESQTIVAITDCGMATSGNYRNFHEENGTRFGHTIDPKTGRPVQTDVLSATVVAQNAMEADAWATSFMVMGSERAEKAAMDNSLAVMLILANNKVWKSEQFKALETE